MTKPYLILARKYRPSTFDEVVGQDGIVTTLKNELSSGRLAQSWLFCGPSGVGKTTLARILARCLSCTGQDKPSAKPCGKCASCTDILAGESLDLMEIDGASNNRVDEVRTLQEHIVFQPQQSRFRIVIIDEVHMLSTAAFNALLKTLEEPPAHVKFIFATTEPDRILPTVRARCQRFDFFQVDLMALTEHINMVAKKEKIKMEEGCAEILAGLAGGSVRDALSLLDQLGGGGEVTEEALRKLSGQALPQHVRELSDLIWKHDSASAVALVDRLSAEGVDLQVLLKQWSQLLRQCLEQKVGAIEHGLMLPADVSVQTLIYQGRFVLNLLKDLKNEPSIPMAMLLAVAKLSAQEDLKPISELIAQLPNVAEESAQNNSQNEMRAPKNEVANLALREESEFQETQHEYVLEKVDSIAPVTVASSEPEAHTEESKPSEAVGDLNLKSLQEKLIDHGHRGAASFLNDAELKVKGQHLYFEIPQPFTLDLLKTKENKEALNKAVGTFVTGATIELNCSRALSGRKEEVETSTTGMPDAGPGEAEKKILDMFDGKKV